MFIPCCTKLDDTVGVGGTGIGRCADPIIVRPVNTFYLLCRIDVHERIPAGFTHSGIIVHAAAKSPRGVCYGEKSMIRSRELVIGTAQGGRGGAAHITRELGHFSDQLLGEAIHYFRARYSVGIGILIDTKAILLGGVHIILQRRMDAATGKELWHKDYIKDFGGKRPEWGFAESPLIDGENVVITPGGAEDRLWRSS